MTWSSHSEPRECERWDPQKKPRRKRLRRGNAPTVAVRENDQHQKATEKIGQLQLL